MPSSGMRMRIHTRKAFMIPIVILKCDILMQVQSPSLYNSLLVACFASNLFYVYRGNKPSDYTYLTNNYRSFVYSAYYCVSIDWKIETNSLLSNKYANKQIPVQVCYIVFFKKHEARRSCCRELLVLYENQNHEVKTLTRMLKMMRSVFCMKKPHSYHEL